MPSLDETKSFIPLNIAVLTISDTRSPDDDKSGATLVERLTGAISSRKLILEVLRESIVSGRLDPRPLYTHAFPLEKLDEALNATRDRPDGFLKALVTLR